MNALLLAVLLAAPAEAPASADKVLEVFEPKPGIWVIFTESRIVHASGDRQLRYYDPKAVRGVSLVVRNKHADLYGGPGFSNLAIGDAADIARAISARSQSGVVKVTPSGKGSRELTRPDRDALINAMGFAKAPPRNRRPAVIPAHVAGWMKHHEALGTVRLELDIPGTNLRTQKQVLEKVETARLALAPTAGDHTLVVTLEKMAENDASGSLLGATAMKSYRVKLRTRLMRGEELLFQDMFLGGALGISEDHARIAMSDAIANAVRSLLLHYAQGQGPL